ncbi:hypothetical protein LG3211_1441 [Lysobacter gummosus]|nr:hypothetical protein LG3211_1441 [Lysobacter gummosus]
MPLLPRLLHSPFPRISYSVIPAKAGSALLRRSRTSSGFRPGCVKVTGSPRSRE